MEKNMSDKQSIYNVDKKINMLSEALKYQTLGWSIVPLHNITTEVFCSCGNHDCSSPGKHPRIKTKEFQTRLASEGEIKGWWQKWPRANIGLITGELSKIIVLDVDEPKGTVTLHKNKFFPGLGVRSETGSGGGHYFYVWPGFRCANHAARIGSTILHNVDFRGDGGLVVLPPSTHISNHNYFWILPPWVTPITEAPGWLLDLIKKQTTYKSSSCSENNGHKPKNSQNDLGWEAEILFGVPEGQRDVAATRLAGKWLRDTKGNVDQVLCMLQGWNQRNNPPLEAEELKKIVDSIHSRQGIDELGAGVGLNIDKICFISSPDGDGRFEFYIKNLSKPVVFTPGDLCTFLRFKGRYLAVTGAHIKNIKSATFDDLMHEAIKEAERIEITDDETNLTPIRDMIISHLTYPGKSLEEINKTIVLIDDMIYLKISTLITFQNDSFERFSRKEIGKLLRDIGFIYSQFRKENKKWKVWSIEKNKMFDQ